MNVIELAKEKGYTFIHPFDDLDVATGQGTISMEIIKELPLVDYILVPIGGGGLASQSDERENAKVETENRKTVSEHAEGRRSDR